MHVTTNFGVLLRLAHELAEAEKTGDSDKITVAKKAHDDYKGLCLSADQMSLGYRHGDL